VADDLEPLRVVLLDMADRQVCVRIRHEPHPDSAELLRAIGATWVVDPRAARCLIHCGRKECQVSIVERKTVTGRTMGQYDAPAGTVPDALREPKPLTFLVRAERCSDCQWPEVCEGDRTCWHDERDERAKRRRHAQEAARAPETGPAEEADTAGDSDVGEDGGAASSAALAEVSGARKNGRRWTRETIVAAIQRWAAEHGQAPFVGDWKHTTTDYPSYGAVQRFFGSWANGIEAAGFPRPSRGKKRPKAAAPVVEGVVDPDVTGNAASQDALPGEDGEPQDSAPPPPRAPSTPEPDEAPPEPDPPLGPVAAHAGRAVELAAIAGVRLTPRIRAALAELLHALGDELLEEPSR
jgi:hypothetical protein